jgi:hypothetical protein
MSVDGYLRALEWHTGSSVDRHVLLVIGATADPKSNWSRATLEHLAAQTGYARSTTAAAVRRLLDAGALERRGTRGRNTNEYHVVGGANRPARADGSSANRPAMADGSTPPTVRQPSANRPPTVRRRASDQHERAHKGEGIRAEGNTPLNPPTLLERVTTEVLPVLAPNGAVPAKARVGVDRFGEFWTAYPRKVVRPRAESAYRSALRRDGPDLIAAGLEAWCAYWTAEGTEEKYIPHPTTFLAQSRYLDQPPAPRRVEPKGFPALRRVVERAAEEGRL